ncbi:hypothetical protein, partial [Streptomyces sp. NPDC021356]|uniref:hypothetical protein n=1 Tax=Streptomyces sp. NPDC021356 TaxID=3154900 RepID=UPI0033CD67FA
MGGSEHLSASGIGIDYEEAPDKSESEARSDRLRTSDKVGTAGKGNAKRKRSGNLESTEEIGSENGLIESET